jgi:hypothetical protein
MAHESKKIATASFRVKSYDPDTETLTILIDKNVFKNKPSIKGMDIKAWEMIGTVPGVNKVIFVTKGD